MDVAAEFQIGEEDDRLRGVLRRGEAGHPGAAYDVFVGIAAGLVFFVHLGPRLPNTLAYVSTSCATMTNETCAGSSGCDPSQIICVRSSAGAYLTGQKG